jgi:hypothetical protein
MDFTKGRRMSPSANRMLRTTSVPHAIRIVLSIAYLILATLKLTGVPAERGFNAIHWAAVSAELSVGAALLFPATYRAALIASCVLSIVFLAASTPLGAWMGVDEASCNCLGSWIKANMALRRSVAAALLAATCFLMTDAKAGAWGAQSNA